MGWANRVGALVVVLLLVSVTFQTAVVKGYEDGPDGDGSRAAPLEDVPGPFRELDRLVAELIAVSTDMTDTDSDGIPDRVETIIGTDAEDPDSDSDGIPDMDEVTNRTDPRSADSNRDGVPDGAEALDGVLDSDSDGTPNAWEADNDGDGVADTRDLSPYVATSVALSHHIEVATSGRPMTLSLQLRTNNPSNMRLSNMVWDWPYDTEGAVRDLDNSTRDVTAVPVLELSGADLPVDPELDGYGIAVVDGTAYVPLYPIYDYGELVALQGQMLFPANATRRGIYLEASLTWRVTGTTDAQLVSIKAPNGRYLSLQPDGHVMATATGVSDTERFELVDMGGRTVMFKASDGRYLSSPWGTELRAASDSAKAGTTFQLEGRGKDVWAIHTEQTERSVDMSSTMSYYLWADPDGYVGPYFDDAPTAACEFTITNDSVVDRHVPLASYPERFVITGMNAYEDLGTDVALVHSDESAELAVNANLYLAYQFLRNASNSALGLPALLEGDGMGVDAVTASFERFDQAMVALVGSMMAEATSGFPDGTLLPVICAMQQNLTFADLSSMGQGRLAPYTTLALDVGGQPELERRSLKACWYNGTGDEVAPMDDVLWRMASWDLDPEDLAVLMTLVVGWSVGEDLVVRVGPTVLPQSSNEATTILSYSIKIPKWGLSGLKGVLSTVYFTLRLGYTAYNAIRQIGGIITGIVLGVAIGGQTVLKATWAGIKELVSIASKTWSSVASIKSGVFGVLNCVNYFLKFTCVIGLIMELGVAAVTVFAVGWSYGWTGLGIFTAVLYGVMMSAYAILNFVLALLGFIPYVGIVFTILATIMSLSDLVVMLIFGKGWVQMLYDLIVDLLTDVKVLCAMYVWDDSSSVDIDDRDGNGLTAGDRITYVQNMKIYSRVSELTRDQVNTTHLTPHVKVYVPYYSNSRTGQSVESTVTWKPFTDDRIVDTTAQGWVEPGMGMVNFPVTVWLSADYSSIYRESYWLFGWHNEYKYTNQTVYTNPFTLYFDVMPATIDDFARWNALRTDDYDGDGVKNADERGNGWMSWDGDGDGLGDAYELEIGTDPTRADSDRDGSDDRMEHIHGTDPELADTDGDGLQDRFETGGWVVDFTYCGEEFAWHVYSDPLLNDTDGDGLSDRMEWLTKQNPRTSDTDGDGTPDALRDYMETTFTQLPDVELVTSPRNVSAGLAMGPDGSLYVAAAEFDLYCHYIQRYGPDGTLETEWGGPSLLHDVRDVTCDAAGNVYAVDSSGNAVLKFDANGTLLGTYGDTGPVLLNYPGSIAVDADGTMYVTTVWEEYPTYYTAVAVYDANGTFLHKIGERGTGPGQFMSLGRVALDAQGLLHVVDRTSDRVQVFQRDGTYVRSYDGRIPGGEPFVDPLAVAFDAAGDVFVVEGGTMRVLKCDPEGKWLATVDPRMLHNRTDVWSADILVTADGTILVADAGNVNVSRLHQDVSVVKVDQRPFADTDGDGLEDAVEMVPWTIDVTDAAGTTLQREVTSDPVDPDTDRDGLGDGEERARGTDPRSIDTDLDGLPDREEVERGTDPCDFDTDDDGLADGTEVALHTDPLEPDTDGEGLTDGFEVEWGSDPLKNDTDGDGLDDRGELQAGSNATDADTDDDGMFDGREAEVGSDPRVQDDDGDGLTDGYEDVYGTDATDDDSDQDRLPDGLEVALRIDPLSGDTDGDGVGDADELDMGLNPRKGDTDGDGVPDGADSSTPPALEGTIHLVADPGADTVGLAGALAKAADVDAVTASELLADHRDARYVVVLGDPATAGKGTAGALVRTLLADDPDALARLGDPSGSDRMAVRYGVWAPKQTVVMLPKARMSDHFRVLGLLRGLQVTVTDGALACACSDPRRELGLDGADAVRATGASLRAVFEAPTAFNASLATLADGDLPAPLAPRTGLGPGEVPLGRYVAVELDATASTVAGATVRLYYTVADLDRTGDGDANDPADVDERTLALFVLDEATGGGWTRLSTDMDGVLATGVDATDVTLYGTRYAGVLWADVTHLSTFGVGGITNAGVVTAARTGPDQAARAGDQVIFDGSASTGVGGIASYEWTFTEGGKEVVLHGFRPVHVFDAPGTYAVTLRVTDAYGGTSEDSFDVTVGRAEAEPAPWTVVAIVVAVLAAVAGLMWFVLRPARPSGRDGKER